MITYIVAVDGLDEVTAGLEEEQRRIRRNAVRANNRTTRDGRVLAARSIRDQVNFTASYLSPSQGRLIVSQNATQANMEGKITGRARPTSLARFTKDKPLQPGQRSARRGKGVRVQVKPGVATYMKGAFLIPLRSGQDGSTNNLGLAVRSDTKPRGAYKPKRLGKNLWLLYGPSVSSILYSARNASREGGVAGQIAPELAQKLEAEFVRLQNAGV